MPKVSVIIPIYGVEKYIERCARSLFEQSLEDIEYIFINDCTPDASVEVLRRVMEEYPQRNGQVRIVDMEHNSGQATVRRCGIEMATGDYIIHCDSDDYVDHDMIGILFENAVSTGMDFVVCGAYECVGDGKTVISFADSVNDILKNVLTTSWGGVLWNKLIRSDIIKSREIQYPTSNFWEDLALTVQYALLSHSPGYVDQPLYYYCRREDSIVGTGQNSYDKGLSNTISAASNYQIVVDALSHWHQSHKYESITIRRQLYIKNQLIRLMPFRGCTRLYNSLCHSANREILFSRYITMREKLLFLSLRSGVYEGLLRVRKILHLCHPMEKSV